MWTNKQTTHGFHQPYGNLAGNPSIRRNHPAAPSNSIHFSIHFFLPLSSPMCVQNARGAYGLQHIVALPLISSQADLIPNQLKNSRVWKCCPQLMMVLNCSSHAHFRVHFLSFTFHCSHTHTPLVVCTSATTSLLVASIVQCSSNVPCLLLPLPSTRQRSRPCMYLHVVSCLWFGNNIPGNFAHSPISSIHS